MRVDKLLFESGLFDSRKKAQVAVQRQLVYLIRQGKEQLIQKVSEDIELQAGDEWKILPDGEFKYVSRSGLKLEGALDHFKKDVHGLICLDIGLSTGGFSDCLLDRGAQFILGVDVGQEQLHERLKKQPRLKHFDKINARWALPEEIMAEVPGGKFDLIVIDVSFISLLLVLEPQLVHLKEKGEIIALIKPQFEVGRANVDKKGIASPEASESLLRDIAIPLEKMNLQILGSVPAQLKGEDGNQEHLMHLKKVPGPIPGDSATSGE